MFLDWLKCTLEKHIQVGFHCTRGYDNEPEAEDDEFDSFVQRKVSPLRLRFCENLKKMYVRQAWGSAT